MLGLVFFLYQKKVQWKQNCRGLNKHMKWKRPEQSQKSQRKCIIFYSEETFLAYFAVHLERLLVCNLL